MFVSAVLNNTIWEQYNNATLKITTIMSCFVSVLSREMTCFHRRSSIRSPLYTILRLTFYQTRAFWHTNKMWKPNIILSHFEKIFILSVSSRLNSLCISEYVVEVELRKEFQVGSLTRKKSW